MRSSAVKSVKRKAGGGGEAAAAVAVGSDVEDEPSVEENVTMVEQLKEPLFGVRFCGICQQRACSDHGPYLFNPNGFPTFKPIDKNDPEVRKKIDEANKARKAKLAAATAAAAKKKKDE